MDTIFILKMKINKKPPQWKNFVFSEKLKWYAKKDNSVKNVFADKLKIKYILEEMDLPNLKYAKLIDYVKPLKEEDFDLNILVNADYLLKDPKYQLADWRIKKLFAQTNDVEEFWKLANEKYGVILRPSDYKEPKFFVMKLNLGWNTMIFFKNNEIIKLVSGGRNYSCKEENLPKWKKYTLEKYTKKIKPVFFLEEFIGFNLKVYEVYCIYGIPTLLSVYYETNISYENNYLIINEKVFNDDTNEFDINFNIELIEDCFLIPKARPLDFKVKIDTVKDICKYAEEFSKYFEFMRVDFYYSKGDIYFSECTFKPGALKKIKWGQIGQILSKHWTSKPSPDNKFIAET